MIGVTLFAVASGLGGLAQNELMLLGSRGLQGLGAALAAPTALALITTNFPAGPPRNRAFSVYAAMSGCRCRGRPGARRLAHRPAPASSACRRRAAGG